MNPYDAEVKALLDQVAFFRAALTRIAEEGAHPGKKHITAVLMAHIARDALSPPEAHP